MPMLFDPFEQLQEFQRALDAFRSSGWLGAGLSAGGRGTGVGGWAAWWQRAPTPLAGRCAPWL